MNTARHSGGVHAVSTLAEVLLNRRRIAYAALLVIITLGILAAFGVPRLRSRAGLPSTPAPDRVTRVPGSANERAVQDYMQTYGVDEQEAARRFGLMAAFSDAFAGIKDEPNYTGHRIRHTPTFGLDFYFTKRGEQTLAPYLEGYDWVDEIEITVHNGMPYTLDELMVYIDRVHGTLIDADVYGYSVVSIDNTGTGLIEVTLMDERYREEIEAALRARGLMRVTTITCCETVTLD